MKYKSISVAKKGGIDPPKDDKKKKPSKEQVDNLKMAYRAMKSRKQAGDEGGQRSFSNAGQGFISKTPKVESEIVAKKKKK